MSVGRLVLAAIEPIPARDWLADIARAAARAAIAVEVEQQMLRIPGRRHEFGLITYSDDVALSRVWLDNGRAALAALGHRRYFDGVTGTRDYRPEREIVGERRPGGPSAAEQVTNRIQLLQRLARQIDGETGLVDVDSLDVQVAMIRIGEREIPVTRSLNDTYKAHGFEAVPPGWTISVCPVDGVSDRFATVVSERLRRAATQRNSEVRTRIVSASVIADRLSEFVGSREAIVGRTVLFLLPAKATAPTHGTRLLLAAMDAAGVRYRRSYADDDLDYSIPDQLPSLLLASGGVPHGVATATGLTGIWTIGIDLNHRRESQTSTLAVTLIDPGGGLARTWLRHQRRDETVRSETIEPVLNALTRVLLQRGADESPIMVLRDGRVFERESADVFFRAIGDSVTILEYRKGGNPPAARTTDPPSCMTAPYAVQVRNTNTLFLAPTPPRNANTLPSVAKVTWRLGWNRLGLTPADIASTLAAQTVMPGLGPHRRTLPAPIYWADGIAGADDTDLRFRGNAPVWM